MVDGDGGVVDDEVPPPLQSKQTEIRLRLSWYVYVLATSFGQKSQNPFDLKMSLLSIYSIKVLSTSYFKSSRVGYIRMVVEARRNGVKTEISKKKPLHFDLNIFKNLKSIL